MKEYLTVGNEPFASDGVGRVQREWIVSNGSFEPGSSVGPTLDASDASEASDADANADCPFCKKKAP